jgi:septum site-determining protein MinC
MTTEPSQHQPANQSGGPADDARVPSPAPLREPDASPLPSDDRFRKRMMRGGATGAAQPRASFRFRGRSFLAFALTPELPIADWLSELDRWLRQSRGFFTGRPVVLDISGAKLTKYDFAGLIAELETRGIRLMGIEGADPSWVGPGLPPLLEGGRTLAAIDAANSPARNARPPKASKPEPTSLLIDDPVRSGQTVFFPNGDVTVVGSVASGAEIVAGGSIHVYGALRGRAMAGAAGNARARIFCSRIEAELLAIDGLYKTADDIEPDLRGRPIQAWLDGNAIRVVALG